MTTRSSLSRRHFIAKGFSKAALLPLISHWTESKATPQKPSFYPLWPGLPPGGGGPTGPLKISRHGAVSNVSTPFLQIHHPMSPNGTVVLIAAGGGYQRINLQHEAIPAARWLTSRGITAAILIYRLPREEWLTGPAAPFEDAQQAIRLIRSRTTDLNFTPSHIGALGFSAGGHLLGMQALKANPDWLRSQQSRSSPVHYAQLDMAMLLYPIVTLEPPFDHTRTRISLIGQHPTHAQREKWSFPNAFTSQPLPLFLAQAEDDPIANPQPSRLFSQHYTAQHGMIETHFFPTGGHGFGLGRPHTLTTTWPSLAEAWMKKKHFI
ncbi:alpha/beta hydrolase fold domain-containing protein [Saccharibacter sp. 17.LH.SD]|uniref:alpha/beta hydrolase n=1 Tax=Saccharibacter sp. 17.LH.SD TaxID=2689393 RepID=UPI0013719781|nr:alpha/beta hydrolase [Saccharibacter sp. 17.LH.SD]MXV44946.1 alpha/beta hydrolase fold domain-containing protein [Saccharibacter sp. 17.LH.SD]